MTSNDHPASQPEPAVTEALRLAQNRVRRLVAAYDTHQAGDLEDEMMGARNYLRALAAVPAPSPAPAAEPSSERERVNRRNGECIWCHSLGAHTDGCPVLMPDEAEARAASPSPAPAAEPQEGEPTTRAGRSTLRDFEEYVHAVPTNSDFAIGGLLDALRKDRKSSLDQIHGAILAIEAEAAANENQRITRALWEARAASPSSAVAPLDVGLLTTALHVADPRYGPDGVGHNPMCDDRAEAIAEAYQSELRKRAAYAEASEQEAGGATGDAPLPERSGRRPAALRGDGQA